MDKAALKSGIISQLIKGRYDFYITEGFKKSFCLFLCELLLIRGGLNSEDENFLK